MIDSVEYRQGPFLISTDQARLNIDTIYDFLANISYWAQGRSLEVTQTTLEHSLCFGVYEGNQQVGFARVVTDYATFGWLCDVFILPTHRGQGLGKWLVACIVAHPDLHSIKRLLLATHDAHGLYQRYGDFHPLPNAERWMEHLKNS